MSTVINDPNFRCIILGKTVNTQAVFMQAAHTDYSEKFIGDEPSWFTMGETEAGERAVKNALKQGHWGLVEHSHITLAFGGFPHSVVQQLRTHRHLSFDVQSLRYSGKRYMTWFNYLNDNGLDIHSDISHQMLERLFYCRPVGEYRNRDGSVINWTENDRYDWYWMLASYMYSLVKQYGGDLSHEMFRDGLPAGYRQNFVMSGNLRAMLHLVSIRGKADAQLECQQAIQMMTPILQDWCPEVVNFFLKSKRMQTLVP